MDNLAAGPVLRRYRHVNARAEIKYVITVCIVLSETISFERTENGVEWRENWTTLSVSKLKNRDWAPTV